MGHCQDKNYSLIPCIDKNCAGEVGLMYSLSRAGSLRLPHQGLTMAVRNVNVLASESVLSTTYIETRGSVLPALCSPALEAALVW